jgi:hypothetical protein
MACKDFATIIAVILMSAHFTSTRRVQTEYLIHHPIHASNQKLLDDQASSFISRSQVESAAVGTKSSGALESGIASSPASKMVHMDREIKQDITMWEWVASGGPFTSTVSSISSAVFRDGGSITDRSINYCSLAIFFFASLACTCRIVEWWKIDRRLGEGDEIRNRYIRKSTRDSKSDARMQYIHRGRVIYEWTQTLKVLTLFTKLPPGQTQETLEIKVWPKHVKVGRKGKVPFIKEALYDAVDVGKCSWAITEAGELKISFVKDMEQAWPCVLFAHHPDQAIRDSQSQRS